jgi:hypothetical protein
MWFILLSVIMLISVIQCADILSFNTLNDVFSIHYAEYFMLIILGIVRHIASRQSVIRQYHLAVSLG